MGGVGGYKTAKAVVAALQSDGHGGTQLSLGTAGHIDFANTAMASLTAPHFAIGKGEEQSWQVGGYQAEPMRVPLQR